MNKIYKVVWSKAKHCYVVTSELAKRNGKGCGARSLRMAAVTTGVTAALLCNGGGLPFCSPSVAEAANVFEYENTSPITLEASSGNTYLATMNEKDCVFGNFKFTVKNDPIVTPNIYVISPKAETRKVGSITINVRTEIIESESNNNYSASNCSVTMTGGTLGHLYGAYGGTTNAESNKVSVSGGTVSGNVYGGYSLAGAANGNTVEISGATVSNLHGGYGKTGADGNKLTVNNSTVWIVRGGSGYDGPATHNTVKIGSGTNFSGSEYYRQVVGGFSNTGAVSGNTVEISGGEISCPSLGVYGGLSNENAASDNTVTISGGTVSGNVYGGWTTNGAAETNHVVMNGGVVGITTTGGKTVFSGGQLYGAYSYNSSGNSGNVTGNTVTINKGTVMADIYGGNTEAKNNKSGDAIKNIVTINGGTLAGDIYGGYSRGDGNPSGKVDGNEVKIAGGVLNKAKVEINGSNVETQGVRFIYGGYTYGNNGPSESTIAYKNAVTISGGTFNNNTEVTGGYSNLYNAELNTVNITKDFSSTVGDVIGGKSVYDTAKENTVTIAGGIVSNAYGGIGSVAEKNSVNITGGTVSSKVYGGHTDFGTAGGDTANDGNKVTISGGTVEGVVYGGYSNTGAVNNNTVSISGGIADFGVTGGYSNTGAVTNNKVTITSGTVIDGIRGGNTYDNNNSGDVKYNAVSISGDAKIRVEGIIGGLSWHSDAIGNTVTISGGSFEPLDPTDPVFNSIPITAGATNRSTAKEEDNVVNITGEVTGLDTASITGYSYGNSNHSGNELHIGGTKTYDSNGTATVSGSDAWQGKSSDGTVNNKVKSVALFESIVLHNVKWSTTLPVLEATKITNVGTLDITNMQFDQTPSNGESMALLKAGNDLGASGAGIGLAYKDGSTEKTATSAELATGVTFDSGALTDTAVNGVSVTGTQSKKVSLENSNYEIRYAFSSTISGITIATNTFTADGTARAFGSGDNLTGATITNNLAFSDESKNSMQSGESMVILDATNAVAVEGATLPAFTSASYDVNFSDAIDGKVVTLSGTHTDTLALNSSKTQLTYTVGDMQVSGAKFDGNVTWDDSASYYTADTKYKFSGTTNVNATGLKVTGTTTNALKVGDAMTLLSAENMTASITNDQSADNKTASKITVNYNDDTTNGIALGAEATGKVAVATNAVNYEVTGVEIQSVDLAGWKGTAVDVQSETDDWTVKSGASITTGELANAGLDAMNPGDVKPILTADTTADFSVANISGNKAWQDGGTITDTDTSGVTVAGATTGGGVKVDDTNKNVLVYQKDAKTITGITLGSVAFTKDGKVRSFDNSYNLTGADFTTTGFGISNASTATMNAGDTMVVVNAVNAIKGTGDATLQDFTTTNAGDAIAFTDQIEGKALTLSGTHQDTLEQNEAKNQILYKVGDKNVTAAIFTGEVAWNDSEAYYTNDTSKYKIAATNVDAEDLIVTGTTTKALKTGDAMTLLSADSMTATIATDQSAANKTASKVTVNYKDGQGVAFAAEAKGAVKAEAAAVKYSINEVKLTEVDLSAWTGSESSVPDTWTAEVGSVKVATGSFAEPDVAIGSARTILTAGSAFFADDNISGANKYDEANGKAFSETQNNVTVSGTQAKGVAASEDSKSLVYKVDIKKADTVSFGATNWQKGATLFDGSSATEYDYANVTAVDAGKFDVTYASPETVAAGESMTLLKANETLTAIINEEKAKAYSFSPVSGVTVDAAITGKLTNSKNNVVFTAAANQASKLTFGDVEWKDSGALLTRPRNITFAGADVDTSRINFTNMIYLDADRQMTLVSDFGDKVGTITGSKYLVGTAFEGEGAASLSGSDLVFRTKTGAGVSEQTHKTVMATEVGVTMLNTGNDYIDKAMEGMGDLANVAPDGTTVGAAIGGGRNRYETGSHVNVNSWNAAVAVGVKRELKNGSLEYGVFGEYGKANFTLHSDAGKGDGDSHYAGGGLLAKWTNKHDVYTEASFRLGRLSESSSDIMRDGLGNTYGYDVHANYYGAHVGVGKIFRYNGGRSLDVYGKYFYTKRDGVEFDAVQHYNLDSVASSVLRIGARYGTTDKKWNWYGGLAYEYEFDGEATGTVKDTAIRAASIKGSSVRGEIGLRMNATKTNPWQTDISIYGYGGKHRGFGGNVNVAYMF